MESMNLTPRLACVAALVPHGACLADVGTDHGKLPIALLRSGEIKTAIGSDIGEGPLSHAARNAKDYGVLLSLRLAPGLQAISPDECDTITIAGMGGQTIAEILQGATWTAQGAHLLILQPMTMIPQLRQWLWKHGYTIERERVCREDRRRYVVMAVRGGADKQVVPLAQCVVSQALLAAPDALDYIHHLLLRERNVLRGMLQAAAPDEKQIQIQKQIVERLEQAEEALQR